MAKLKKFKIEIELAAPDYTEMEDIYEYISALTRESDISDLNDIFAVGNIEILDEGNITVEEWNGDPIDEIDLEELV